MWQVRRVETKVTQGPGNSPSEAALRTLLLNQIWGITFFDRVTLGDEPLPRVMLQRDRIDELIEAAAKGIMDLGASECSMTNARRLTHDLLRKRMDGLDAVLDAAILLYTEESFLYKNDERRTEDARM
jgi:hypothetical protein